MTTNKKLKQSDIVSEYKSLLRKQKKRFLEESIILTDADPT